MSKHIYNMFLMWLCDVIINMFESRPFVVVAVQRPTHFYFYVYLKILREEPIDI